MANKPNGNLTGIKSAMLDRLKSLYDFKQGLDEFASFELLSELCACSGEINREISVYISRDGSIVDVSVGDSAKVSMPSMRLVRNEDRLCGVRCIHTHPSGDGRLSGVDLGTLRSMKLDCMAAVGVSDGKPTQLLRGLSRRFRRRHRQPRRACVRTHAALQAPAKSTDCGNFQFG